jgi:predicted PurR-regulated permease PerM
MRTEKGPEKRSPVQNAALGAILILLFVLVCRLFAPFFTVLLWSILFYILLSPMHRRITSKLDHTKTSGKVLLSLWAALFSAGTVVIILLPLSFVGFQFFKQITELINAIRDYLASHSGQTMANLMLEDISRGIEEFSSGQIVIDPGDMRSRMLMFLSSGLQTLIQFSRNLAMNVSSFFAGLVFMIFSLFFFYLDGAYLLSLALHVIPIKNDYINALVGKFKEITKNLVLGYIMVALVQAVLAYLIFVIFQVRGALVFAALTFICVFIPIIGGGLVWLPLGIVRILGGNLVQGIVFIVVSGIFISTLDNIIRPIFLKNQIQLHPLIIFFAILGGLRVFGFNGIIMGPMVVILFLTVLDLFLIEHKIKQDLT